jgi:thiamine-phosphate pyrophosphorylase
LSVLIYQERLAKFINEVTLYPVSCEKLADGRSDLQWLDGVLAGGAKIVQLRDKVSSDRQLLAKAKKFREKTKEAGVLFMVNDRVDIALMAGADGVHLGNDDLPVPDVRRIAPDFLIGVSANTKEQARAAESVGASYFNIGPLFPTNTKENLKKFLGIEAINEYSSLSRLPFTVMGGIKFDNIPELVSSGARRIAVVTAITMAENFENETRKWIESI